MRIVELIRLESSTQGVLGILRINKQIFCCTLEPQDLLNRPNESCVPTGQYVCKTYASPERGMVFIVKDVPNRHGILVHSGNTADDTEGCILLGSEHGKLRGNRAVLNSGKTFQRFKDVMVEDGEFHLTVTEAY